MWLKMTTEHVTKRFYQLTDHAKNLKTILIHLVIGVQKKLDLKAVAFLCLS